MFNTLSNPCEIRFIRFTTMTKHKLQILEKKSVKCNFYPINSRLFEETQKKRA